MSSSPFGMIVVDVLFVKEDSKVIFDKEEGVGEDGGRVFTRKKELVYCVLLRVKIQERVVRAAVICP